LRKLKRKKKKKVTEGYFIEFAKSENLHVHALTRILDFCYSGQVDYGTFTPFKALEVLKISGIYKMEGLHQFCIKYVQSSINEDNIFKLLFSCDKEGVEDGKKICIDYAVNHEDLFTSAEAEVLGFKLYQEVTTAILKAKKEEKHVVKLAFEDPIVENFKTIYESDNKDTTFFLHDQEIKVHKAILMNQSSAELVELVTENEKKNNQYYTLDAKYNNITPEALDSMFRFFYYHETKMDILHACQLFLFCKEMKLGKLSHTIEIVLNQKEFNLNSILPILDVAFSPLMNTNPELQKQLQHNGLRFAVENINKIEFIELQKMNPLIGMNILQLLQKGLSESWDIISQISTPRIQSERITRGSSFTKTKSKASENNVTDDTITLSETGGRRRVRQQKFRTLDRKKKSTSTDKVTERKTPRKATKTNPQ